MDLSKALKLYVIPDRNIGAPLTLMEQVSRSVKGGATAVQLRDKKMSGKGLYEEALKMAEFCRSHEILFIVNDRVDIALGSGAMGIHVGQSDIPCHVVRKLVPSDFIVGVTVRTPEQALKAQEEGADYIGAGALFPTGTKKDTELIGLNGFSRIVEAVRIPVVAIGGIEKNNVSLAFQNGASGIATVSSIFAENDITNAAAKMFSLCSR